MKPPLSALCVLVLWLAAGPMFAADPVVVDLWPGKPADDDASSIGPEKFFELNVNGKPYHVGGKPTKWLTNVTKPTLSIYRPAKDKDTRAAMIICPGGGYHNLGWDIEGEEVAQWLNSLGVTGIILKYRCPRRPGDVKGEPPLGPLKDAQRAVSLVRSKAGEWGLDPKQIGMIGFSAGGHLVGAAATNFGKRAYEPLDDIDKVSCRPDFAIMLYSGYFKVKDKEELSPTIRIAPDAPPMFIVHASDDPISDVDHSVTMFLAMKRAGVPTEMHVYAAGGHGFAVRKIDRPCDSWAERCTAWLLSQGFLKAAAAAPAAAPEKKAAAGQPREAAEAMLEKHCVQCHSGEKPKGKLDLKGLARDFTGDAARKRWLAVAERVKNGSMPPKTKPRPEEQEVKALTDWIGAGVATADAGRRAEGRVVFRRLNRVEYDNTVRDLLGISVELKELLPLDATSGGFDNVGEAQHVSSFLMDRYLEAADTALNAAIVNFPQPPLVKKRYSLTETHHFKSSTEKVYRKFEDGGLVLFSSSPWNAVTLTPFYPPDRGRYRFRISAYGTQSSDKPVSYRIDAGPMLMGTKNHLVGYFDAPPGKPAVAEFVDYLEARSHIRISPYGLASAQVVDKIGSETYEGPGLAVEWVEAEGPLYDSWPPPSHRRIFGDLPQGPAPNNNRRDRLEVVSKDPLPDAERILRSFARRAFRRAVNDAEIKPLVALVEARMAEKYTFEEAVRVGLKAIMVSPSFLFLREPAGKLDDFALASRLSYFLWSTMPDEKLLALAEQNKLGDSQTLRQQVERMLTDPKAAAFTENFVGQWLGLRELDFTIPSHILYPEFDDLLRASMQRESELFFAEVLKDDLSLTNFVASDFSMLNGSLAKLYGIPGVEGWEFTKTPLPADSHRGGVMTMASVLKVTANGTSTSPVMRGAWVLDRILGTPPPKPPENVAALEPDTRGATTIREQLAKHRQIESCASCHKQIDPPGFALESFDVIGGYREHYRTSGNGKPVTINGRRMPYLEGKPIDPSDVLPDGRKFASSDEFKQLLLADKDQLARALTTRLVTYSTGAAPETAAAAEIDAVVAKVRAKNYGLRSLVHEIVQSELFRNK